MVATPCSASQTNKSGDSSTNSNSKNRNLACGLLRLLVGPCIGRAHIRGFPLSSMFFFSFPHMPCQTRLGPLFRMTFGPSVLFFSSLFGWKAFMYAYSLREKTRAARRLEDDVPPTVKQRRLEVTSPHTSLSHGCTYARVI